MELNSSEFVAIPEGAERVVRVTNGTVEIRAVPKSGGAARQMLLRKGEQVFLTDSFDYSARSAQFPALSSVSIGTAIPVRPAQPGIGNDMKAVTPSNDADLPFVADALYVSRFGNLVIVTAAGTQLTLEVPDNFILPVRVRRVMATGTTATGIHSLHY